MPAPDTGFVAVAAGPSHSLALRSNGSIAAWGLNDYGQCNVPSPNRDFIAVAGGWWHSLGLKSNGTIVAWGNNTYHQRDVPSPNSGFIAIAAGTYHSAGLKSDGTIVCWGDTTYGECTILSPNSNYMAIAALGGRTLALRRSPASSVDALPVLSDPYALRVLFVSPNPFSGPTRVLFQALQPGAPDLEVYDVAGRLVNASSLGQVDPGLHWATWDGRDRAGDPACAGVYFIRLRTGARSSDPVRAVRLW